MMKLVLVDNGNTRKLTVNLQLVDFLYDGCWFACKLQLYCTLYIFYILAFFNKSIFALFKFMFNLWIADDRTNHEREVEEGFEKYE